MTSDPPRLLVATTNPGELREYQELLAGLPVSWVTLADVGLADMDVQETGETSTRTLAPTETDTLTRTPTDTPEPTNTPRPPTLTDTPVPALAYLSLIAQCSPYPASYRVWAVYNPNPMDVAFSWNVRHSDFAQAGGGTAPADGTTGFTTTTEQNSNTVELWANGSLNASHSGNADHCE